MPTLPNSNTVVETIQAIVTVMPGVPATVDGISATIASINSSDALAFASNGAQVVATVVSVGAVVGLTTAPVVLGASLIAVTITLTKGVVEASNPNVDTRINIGDVVTILGNLTTIASTGLPAASLLATAWTVAGGVLTTAGLMESNYPGGIPHILSDVSAAWSAVFVPPRRDPLAIDLDGDGIEAVGIPASGNPILFDHDADGIKTGTGWVKSDDAWLVLDRDGNGTIDSGRELFGVDTLITVTETLPGGSQAVTYTRNARTGFEALRTLDTGNGTAGSTGHGDGVFNASDAAFSQVRLWQDLNQDGVSQASELFTLADKGITRINLNETTASTNLGNGNTVTGHATVTRSNGSTTQRPP